MEETPKKRITLTRPTPSQRKAAEERRLAPMMRALKAVHSAAIADTIDADDLARQRRAQDLFGRLVAPLGGMRWEPLEIGPVSAAWCYPTRGYDRRHAILYCHGGGYTSGNLGYSRILASKLAHVTGYPVLSFAYRLAPEHPYPAALEDAVAAWDYLMHLGYGSRDITIAGDSAGGNLALVLTRHIQQAKRKLPARLVLMSPWTDMTASGKSYEECADLDPTLSMTYIKAVRSAYAGDEDFSSPALSPLFGSFEGFPPTLIQVGSNEILRSDSVRLRDRMLQSAVTCKLEVWRDMWHVFQMFPTKRANEAMESVARFLLEQNF